VLFAQPSSLTGKTERGFREALPACGLCNSPARPFAQPHLVLVPVAALPIFAIRPRGAFSTLVVSLAKHGLRGIHEHPKNALARGSNTNLADDLVCSLAPTAPRSARCAAPDPCPPASHPQQRRDSSVAIAAILRGQRDDRSGQRILIDPLDRLIALCPSPLPQQPASIPFAHLVLRSDMLHCTTAPLGA